MIVTGLNSFPRNSVESRCNISYKDEVTAKVINIPGAFCKRLPFIHLPDENIVFSIV